MNHKGLVTFDRKYKKTAFMLIRLGFPKADAPYLRKEVC